MIDFKKVTLGKFIAYVKLTEEWRPRLDELFDDPEEATNLELFTLCPEYVEVIIQFWTEWSNLKQMDASVVLGAFSAIQRLTEIPKPQAINHFVLNSITYSAPDDEQLLEKLVPMGKISFGQALEALHIEQLMEGNVAMIPYVLASIFTREEESMEDIELGLRAKEFEELPLTTAYNAYFFLGAFVNSWSRRLSHSLTEEATQEPLKPE